FKSTAPVVLEGCKVYIERSEFSTDRDERPLSLVGSSGIVKLSKFDANFKDCDALSIGPRSEFFKRPHRHNYMEKGYGEPENRNMSWMWASKRSEVNGKEA